MKNFRIDEKIKGLCERARLTETQIAQFLKVEQSDISMCETGEYPFQVDQLEQLGNLFYIALADLMNENAQVEPLGITWHANGLAVEDLTAIADVHKIALNLEQMRTLLQENACNAQEW